MQVVEWLSTMSGQQASREPTQPLQLTPGGQRPRRTDQTLITSQRYQPCQPATLLG